MAAGIPRGRRPEFQGGGLLRSLGGWHAVAQLRRGREAYLGDERILGSSGFVEHLRRAVEEQEAAHLHLRLRGTDLPTLLHRVATAAALSLTALTGGGRSRMVARARDGLAYLWVDVLGRSGHDLARALALHAVSVYRAARRGQTHQARWNPVVRGKS